MTGLEPASFQVERFERTESGLELSGRWFGVRGRRFMRPALTTSSGGSEQRMLAVLDHKPWVAEEGETWLAAFPCSSDPATLDQAELTVAPDVTVALPAPSRGSVDGRKRRRRAGSRGPSARSTQARAVARPTQPTPADARETVVLPVDEGDVAESDLRRERDAAVRSRDEALAAVEQARRTEARAAAQAAAERDRARSARDEAIRERDEAGREREAAREERDNAEHERNRMLAERDTARARVHETTRQWELTAELGTRRTLERDALAVERDRLARERDAAVEARAHLSREHEVALAEREVVERARDAALRERDRMARERDTALRARERMASERTSAAKPRQAVEKRPLAQAPRGDADQPTRRFEERDETLTDLRAQEGAETRPPIAARMRPAVRLRDAVAIDASVRGPQARPLDEASEIWRQRLLAVSALLVALTVLVVLLLAK